MNRFYASVMERIFRDFVYRTPVRKGISTRKIQEMPLNEGKIRIYTSRWKAENLGGGQVRAEISTPHNNVNGILLS